MINQLAWFILILWLEKYKDKGIYNNIKYMNSDYILWKAFFKFLINLIAKFLFSYIQLRN